MNRQWSTYTSAFGIRNRLFRSFAWFFVATRARCSAFKKKTWRAARFANSSACFSNCRLSASLRIRLPPANLRNFPLLVRSRLGRFLGRRLLTSAIEFGASLRLLPGVLRIRLPACRIVELPRLCEFGSRLPIS